MITTPETQYIQLDTTQNNPQTIAQKVEWYNMVSYLMQYQIVCSDRE